MDIIKIEVTEEDLQEALASTSWRRSTSCLVAQATTRTLGEPTSVGIDTISTARGRLKSYRMDKVGKKLVEAYDLWRLDDILFPVTFTATRII